MYFHSYSSSFQKCNCWTRHINIKSLFRAVRMMESTRCRYSVVSFLSRSDHNRETTTTNGRDLTTTRPACAPSITRPWIMECEKKLLKIRSEHWNLGEWCVMVRILSFENIWSPREVAWDLCLRHALLSFKLPLENLSVDCQQPGELVPTASWYFLATLEIC